MKKPPSGTGMGGFFQDMQALPGAVQNPKRFYSIMARTSENLTIR